MKDFVRFIKQDSITFFIHAARILVVYALVFLFVWIINPFENAGQIFFLGLLHGVLVLLLLWFLYVIIEFFSYRKHIR